MPPCHHSSPIHPTTPPLVYNTPTNTTGFPRSQPGNSFHSYTHPQPLQVHIQWTGNDDTNNNGNNNGEGTNSEDRHNIVQLDNSGRKHAPTIYAARPDAPNATPPI